MSVFKLLCFTTCSLYTSSCLMHAITFLQFEPTMSACFEYADTIIGLHPSANRYQGWWFGGPSHRAWSSQQEHIKTWEEDFDQHISWNGAHLCVDRREGEQGWVAVMHLQPGLSSLLPRCPAAASSQALQGSNSASPRLYLTHRQHLAQKPKVYAIGH